MKSKLGSNPSYVAALFLSSFLAVGASWSTETLQSAKPEAVVSILARVAPRIERSNPPNRQTYFIIDESSYPASAYHAYSSGAVVPQERLGLTSLVELKVHDIGSSKRTLVLEILAVKEPSNYKGGR